MKKRNPYIFGLILLLIVAFGVVVTLRYLIPRENAELNSIRIQWDANNVAHVYGDQYQVYFGNAWAQMRNHANTILSSYGKARGKSAEYFGEAGDFQNDVLVRRLGIPERSQSWKLEQNATSIKRLEAFVNGVNRFCDENPSLIEEAASKVLPVTVEDLFNLLQLNYHLKVGAFALQQDAAQWNSAGSNAWAISGSKMTDNNPVLLMQPHPPWMDGYLFQEIHMHAPEFNIYGICSLGLPSIVMGFNENLGWGLTFNQADVYDLLEAPQGVTEDRIISRLTTYVKRSAGGQLDSTEIEVIQTDLGPVVSKKGDTLLILRLSGFDRPHFFDQFEAMARSGDFKEFESSLKMLQLPLQNIIYADKEDNIYYLYNGLIPQRTKSDWYGGQSIQPFHSFAKDWSYLPFDSLPNITNPSSGYIANSNNTPWTTITSGELTPESYPSYIAPAPFDYFTARSRQSNKLLTSKAKFTYEDILRMQFSTHSEVADRTLEDLIAYSRNSSDTLLSDAVELLSSWDGNLNPESKGAVLFLEWLSQLEDVEQVYTTSFDPENPLHTPRDLSPEACMRLNEAAHATWDKYGDLEISLGEIYRVDLRDTVYPSPVGIDAAGSFNAGFYMPAQENQMRLLGGTAYSCVVQFGDSVVAHGLSPYAPVRQIGRNETFNDQIQLMIEKRARPIHFYRDDVKSNTIYEERIKLDPSQVPQL